MQLLQLEKAELEMQLKMKSAPPEGEGDGETKRKGRRSRLSMAVKTSMANIAALRTLKPGEDGRLGSMSLGNIIYI